ncbi:MULTISPECIES: DUF6492 family protein [unclassified Aureimonas]|uniref:DUF6492 family protein n=1 Tax=unclassified Aureimonas TaxID=2615206 RepID=UPI0006F53738|nr:MULTISPECIES: DUF6492 family protein [unclassified Aureimonas]KQT69805.1 hypothetical protein ASG62_01455 [Aureimonas sp. Leaf427]KQT76043.1 hypothetical protein ASG54_14765 [Aureimonas sp. Leaf460]
MSVALVTASYRGDLERFALLCESIDARVLGHTRHLVLVEDADLALFRPFAGPKREIVAESDLLPRWLRVFPDPTNFGRRRIWLSPFGPPLRGWHVQQLRRIAIGAALSEDVMVTLDSDAVVVRDFDAGLFEAGGVTEFYRIPRGLPAHDPVLDKHRSWSRLAGRILGIAGPDVTETDYISSLAAWRTQSVRAMTARIEAVTGRSWARTLAGTRAISEYTIYGRFVEEVEGRPDLHRATDLKRCSTLWSGEALDEASLGAFMRALGPDQVAIGIQSFLGTDLALIRRAAGLDRDRRTAA